MIKPGIYLLALLLFLAPLPMGCVHCWSFYLLLLLVNFTTLLLLRDERRALNRHFHLFIYGFIALGIFQLLPLPKFLLKVLSPREVSLLEMAGVKFTFHPLSLLPASTFLYLIAFSSFALLGIALWRRNWHREEYLLILKTAVLSGAFQGLISLLKFAGRARRVFALWGPYTAFPSGTLRNPDHLSALAEMTLPLAVGYIIYRIKRDGWGFFLRSWEIIFLLAPFLILAGIVLSGSRAGLAATGLSIYAFAQMLLQKIPRSGYSRTSRGFFLVLLITVVLLGGLFTFKKGVPRIRHQIWGLSLRAFYSYPVFGSGLGTFPDLIETYRTEPEFTALIGHAHNDYLEIMIEAGIAGAILLFYPLMLVFYETYENWEKRRYPLVKYLGAGLISSILAIGFHSFFDFPLRIPAIALMFVTFFAASATIVELRRRR